MKKNLWSTSHKDRKWPDFHISFSVRVAYYMSYPKWPIKEIHHLVVKLLLSILCKQACSMRVGRHGWEWQRTELSVRVLTLLTAATAPTEKTPAQK